MKIADTSFNYIIWDILNLVDLYLKLPALFFQTGKMFLTFETIWKPWHQETG